MLWAIAVSGWSIAGAIGQADIAEALVLRSLEPIAADSTISVMSVAIAVQGVCKKLRA